MRKSVTFLLILLATLATTASAQWLETRILLPESLLALKSPEVLLCDPAHNAVYIGGESGVVVLDAATGASRARLLAPGQVSALCLNPEREKLYVACKYERLVLVADCITMQVLSSFPVAVPLDRMVYSPATDRIFAAGSNGDAVTVIDCARDSAAGRLTGFLGIDDICINPEGTKLYCADGSLETVYVMDCAAGVVLGSVWTGSGPFRLLYNYVADKVYCSDQVDEDVAVIDAVRDSLIRFIPLDAPTGILALNPLLNRVYCADGYSLIGVISGSGDSVLALAYCQGRPSVMAFDSAANVLCAAAESEDTVVLIDGSDNSLLGILPTGDWPGAIAYNPVAGLVQIANVDDATVTSVDCTRVQVVDTKVLAVTPDQLAWAGNVNRVYAADAEIGKVAVIDGATNQVAGFVPLGHAAQVLLPVPAEGKVYCASWDPSSNSSRLSVISQPGDSVTRVFWFSGHAASLVYTSGRLLYCVTTSSSPQLLRIDCRNDSMLGATQLLSTDGEMVYAEAENRLFITASEAIQVFSADSGTNVVNFRLDGYPWKLAYLAGQGVVAVTCLDSSAVAFIDDGSCSLLAWIPVGHHPTTMCYNARHGWLYCAVDGPQLVVVDVAQQVPVATRPISASGPAMLLDTISDRLYLQGGEVLEVVDCSQDQRILFRMPTGHYDGTAWNPVNRRVYISDGDRSALFVIRDSAVTGIAEAGESVTTQFRLPTIVRGILLLPAASGQRSAKGVSLLDITGRKALDLHPGANDVSRLAPGVYFMRSAERGQGSGTHRVIVAR